MLIPFRQLFPLRIAAATSFVTQLETQLPVLPILNPRIFFKNTAPSASVRVEIQHILDLGVSDDPLLTGTFPTVIVDETVLASELLMHHFNATSLTTTLVRHQITVENLAVADEVIVQMWVEGHFEESLKDLPEFEPIFI